MKQDRRGKSQWNWESHHHEQIQQCDNRHNLVWTDWDFTNDPNESEAYMNWFRNITVVYLTKPGIHPDEGIHEGASSHHFVVS